MRKESEGFRALGDITFYQWLLLLILAWCLCSCGSNYHLRRAEHHLKKAGVKGAEWKSDTVFKDIIIPEVKFDTVVKVETFADTITIEKDRIVTKVKVNTITKEVFVATKCPPDTVRVETIITNEINPEKGFMFYFPWVLVILSIAGIAYLIKCVKTK